MSGVSNLVIKHKDVVYEVLIIRQENRGRTEVKIMDANKNAAENIYIFLVDTTVNPDLSDTEIEAVARIKLDKFLSNQVTERCDFENKNK